MYYCKSSAGERSIAPVHYHSRNRQIECYLRQRSQGEGPGGAGPGVEGGGCECRPRGGPVRLCACEQAARLVRPFFTIFCPSSEARPFFRDPRGHRSNKLFFTYINTFRTSTTFTLIISTLD